MLLPNSDNDDIDDDDDDDDMDVVHCLCLLDDLSSLSQEDNQSTTEKTPTQLLALTGVPWYFVAGVGGGMCGRGLVITEISFSQSNIYPP